MQPIILLHGALGSANQLQPLAEALESNFEVHTFNFSGHGGRPFGNKQFSISLFSEQINEYMQVSGISRAPVFGYSMGGYAAMYLASPPRWPSSSSPRCSSEQATIPAVGANATSIPPSAELPSVSTGTPSISHGNRRISAPGMARTSSGRAVSWRGGWLRRARGLSRSSGSGT